MSPVKCELGIFFNHGIPNFFYCVQPLNLDEFFNKIFYNHVLFI